MSAGWFPDPQDPSLVRYWDGTAWTEHTSSAQPTPAYGAPVPPPAPAKTSRNALWIAMALVVILAGAAVGGWLIFGQSDPTGPATTADIRNLLARDGIDCMMGETYSRELAVEVADSAEEKNDAAWADAMRAAIEREPGVQEFRTYYCWDRTVEDSEDPDAIAPSYLDVVTAVEESADRPLLVSLSPDHELESELVELDVEVLVGPFPVDWMTDDFIDSLQEPRADDADGG